MNAACGYMVGGPPVGGPGGVPYHESDDQSRLRFQVELEFVQCLANPNYLNFLAQRGYLKEKEFVNYLKYLLYWKNPEYAAYLKYPQCLHLLELLQYEGFRTEIINTPCAKFIEDQLLLHWQHYPRKRLKLLEQHAAADASSPAAASAGGNHPPNVLPPPSSSSTAPTPSPSIDTAPNSALTAGGGPSSVGGGGQSGPSTPHSNAGPPKS